MPSSPGANPAEKLPPHSPLFHSRLSVLNDIWLEKDAALKENRRLVEEMAALDSAHQQGYHALEKHNRDLMGEIADLRGEFANLEIHQKDVAGELTQLKHAYKALEKHYLDSIASVEPHNEENA